MTTSANNSDPMIDFDSVLNPLFLADPKQAAIHAVIEAFPLGILGYEIARQGAERNGNATAFQEKINALAAKAEVRITLLTRCFVTYASYLRSRHAAQQVGEEALAKFDSDVEARIALLSNTPAVATNA